MGVGWAQNDILFLNLRDRRSAADPLDCQTYRQILAEAEAQGFQVVFEKDGVIVLERGNGDRESLPSLLSNCS